MDLGKWTKIKLEELAECVLALAQVISLSDSGRCVVIIFYPQLSGEEGKPEMSQMTFQVLNSDSEVRYSNYYSERRSSFSDIN